MENTGYIQIRVSGTNGGVELKPESCDIRDIIEILENVEDLLCPNEKQNRPVISYEISEGSVRHVLKTSLQFVIGFNAVIGQINNTSTINFLDGRTAKAFENIQLAAIKKNYNFEVDTSIANSHKILINSNTKYFVEKGLWVDAEFYFYGKITNAGGKDKANIHISTDMGVLRIQTPISFLEKYENNILYKTMGIRAAGKQNIQTCEIDTATLKFIELIDYQLKYDNDYLSKLRKNAQQWISNIDADAWLREVRGGYDG